MNSAKQFWALFKFQALANPFLLVLPIAFSFPMLLPLLGRYAVASDVDFFELTFNPMLAPVGVFAAMIMAPDRLMFAGGGASMAQFGSEFVLTRAVDRPVVYRARAALLYVLLLVLPLLGLVHAAQHPDVVVREYTPKIQQQALALAPGSALLPPDSAHGKPSQIAIPRGQLLAAEYQLLTPLLLLCLMQIGVLLLHPLRYGKVIFWCLYVALAFAPFLSIPSAHSALPTLSERAFFLRAGHELVVLAATAVVFIATQLVCERWFARLEA